MVVFNNDLVFLKSQRRFIIKRPINQLLDNWAAGQRRKPLLLRGARQVGKTYAIETLAQSSFNNQLVKIDFEKMPLLRKIFIQDLDVVRIVADLELATGQSIIAGKTLLFLDEIQHCPAALMALRYFYEEMPDLHVVGAGSLLEFILSEISFPVGRVQFMNMYPMTFVEYLMAVNRENLAQILQENPKILSETIHTVLRQELYRYFMIAGPTIKNAVTLLTSAQVITQIPACHPPVLPLAASAHTKTFFNLSQRTHRLLLHLNQCRNPALCHILIRFNRFENHEAAHYG